jgi:hypothetical protein
MLSHSIDKTKRDDESTACSRLSNYESGSRIPRNARFRRQVDGKEAGTAAVEKESSSNSEEHEANAPEAPDSMAEQIPVADTEKGSQSSAEEESQQNDKLNSTQKHVDPVNTATTYVLVFLF